MHSHLPCLVLVVVKRMGKSSTDRELRVTGVSDGDVFG